MSGFNRLSLPSEFYDRTSQIMLRAPEPQYIYARMVVMADAAAELRRIGEIGLPGRTISGSGAGVPALMDMQAIISDNIRSEAIITSDELGSGVGHTLRMNRPVFSGGGYTAASRRIARGQIISTTAIDVSAEQVSLTIALQGGPFASGGSVPQPYMVSKVDAQRGVHNIVALSGLHLYRDRTKYLDSVYRSLFDPFGTSSTSILYPGDPGSLITADSAAVFPAVNSRPFDLECLLRTERTLDAANVPRFANGQFICVLTPQQAQQLMLDPEYQRLSDKEYFSTQTHNPLRTNAVGQVSGIEVYKSSTNTIDTATVSGQSIHHGVMFGPGMVGRATTPDGCFTASPTDDNYGFDVKVMWFALEAEGLLDERFGRVMHSN
jgi:hypothetical protein